MRLSSTILLLLVALAVAAFVVFYERDQRTTTERDARSGVLVEFVSNEINEMRVGSGTRTTFANLAEDGNWISQKPEGERLDPAWIEEILKLAQDLEPSDTIPGEIDGGLAPSTVGFGPEQVRLRLSSGSGEPINLLFGAPAAFEDSCYAIVGAKPLPGRPMHVVRPNPRPLLTRPRPEQRDPKLLRIDPDTILAMTLRSEAGEIGLERNSLEEFWSLTRPLQTRADREAPDQILAALVKTEILGTAKPVSSPSSGEESPLSIDLRTSLDPEAVPLTISLWPGNNGDPAVARTSDRPDAYPVESRLFKMLAARPNDLRDPFLARIDLASLAGISVRSRGQKEAVLRRRGDAWLLDREGQNEGANPGRVQNLIEQLNNHIIVDFVSDTASDLPRFGLDNPILEIELRNADSEAKHLAGNRSKLDMEHAVVLQIGGGQDGKIYAHYADTPFIYQVGPELLNHIPTEPIKWKGLPLLRFSIFSLRSITLTPRGQPPLELKYEYQFARWTAKRAGSDISDLIQRRGIEELMSELSVLEADDWTADRAAGFAALKNPEMEMAFEIAPPPGSPEGNAPFNIKLSFAPTAGENSAYYYGRLDSVPEVFILSRQRYQQISRLPLQAP